MPDGLQIAPIEERNFIPAISIAGLLLATIAVVVFLVNPRETAGLTVTKVDTFAPHTEFTASSHSMHVLGSAPGSEDNLYVVAHIKLTDKLRLPLFILDYTVTLNNADGTSVVATAISPRYYGRIEQTFPRLTPLLDNPVHDGDQIDPGKSDEGCILVNFPGMTQDDWKNRRSAILSINLRNQSPQTVVIP